MSRVYWLKLPQGDSSAVELSSVRRFFSRNFLKRYWMLNSPVNTSRLLSFITPGDML